MVTAGNACDRSITIDTEVCVGYSKYLRIDWATNKIITPVKATKETAQKARLCLLLLRAMPGRAWVEVLRANSRMIERRRGFGGFDSQASLITGASEIWSLVWALEADLDGRNGKWALVSHWSYQNSPIANVPFVCWFRFLLSRFSRINNRDICCWFLRHD